MCEKAEGEARERSKQKVILEVTDGEQGEILKDGKVGKTVTDKMTLIPE